MTKPTTEELKDLLSKVTPGPWVTSETTIHGVKYGGLWVKGADQPDDDGLMQPPLICISGSGGARSYTTRIVDRQDHDDNDANATIIALAPTLAAEVVELREALEFYADRHYDGYDVELGDYGLSMRTGKIILDCGELARKALDATQTP